MVIFICVGLVVDFLQSKVYFNPIINVARGLIKQCHFTKLINTHLRILIKGFLKVSFWYCLQRDQLVTAVTSPDHKFSQVFTSDISIMNADVVMTPVSV